MSNPNGSVENQNAGGNMKSEDCIHEILDEKRFPWEHDYPQSKLHTGKQNKTDCICGYAVCALNIHVRLSILKILS